MGPARTGPGTATRVSFAVRKGSLPYWAKRLESLGVRPGPPEFRFGENVLPFQDPHGLPLALVETGGGPAVPWERSPVDAEHQLLGFHSVRLAVRVAAATEALLAEEMGFVFSAEEAGIRRHETDGGGTGRIVELVERPGERRGEWGTGGVHHVAWRVRHAEEEDLLRASLARAGWNPTPPIDRFWFRSVYFREPGGVLFELATDGPGFAVDEEEGKLGERLVLPPWLEGRREEIEAALPPLETTAPPVAGERERGTK
jgi:glyoxalase family protein